MPARTGVRREGRGELPDLIGEIYEAACAPERWTAVLGRVAELTDARTASLLYNDHQSPAANAVFHWGIPPATVKAYLEHYAARDPFYRYTAERVPVGEVVAQNLLIPDPGERRALAGDFYRFMTEHGIYHIAGANLFVDESRIGAITVHRPREWPTWTAHEIHRLQPLIPHFQRAFRIHRQLVDLRAREASLFAMLDSLVTAVILLDRFGRMLYRNPPAESLLREHPAILIRGKKLRPAAAAQADAFQAMIRDVLEAEPGAVCGVRRAMGLRCPLGGAPLPVLAVPIHATGLPIGSRQIGEEVKAALFLSDPDRPSAISPEALGAVYDLSPAEARIAVLLANGYTAEQIAEAAGVSLATVRSQIRAAFRKTGVARQPELVRLVLASPFAQVSGLGSP